VVCSAARTCRFFYSSRKMRFHCGAFSPTDFPLRFITMRTKQSKHIFKYPFRHALNRYAMKSLPSIYRHLTTIGCQLLTTRNTLKVEITDNFFIIHLSIILSVERDEQIFISTWTVTVINIFFVELNFILGRNTPNRSSVEKFAGLFPKTTVRT